MSTTPRVVTANLLTDQVYAILQRAIVNGEMPAGARLRVRELAARVGTSVMPVREAIRRLEEAGLAEREPHKGAVVKGLTLEQLVHVYDARRLLEGEAARLGAARISDEECEAMRAEYGRLRAALDEGRMVDYLDHDEALLTILYRAGGNPVLVDLIDNLWLHCRAYKVVGVQTPPPPEEDFYWRHQEALLSAARAHDPVAAAAASSASLAEATENIKGQLAAQRAASEEESQVGGLQAADADILTG